MVKNLLFGDKPKRDWSNQDWKSEAQFQASCTGWFDETFPDKRGQLMLLYQNPPNAIIGAKLISMGLRPGSTDHLYVYGFRQIAWIEYKIGYNKQSKPQEEFQELIERLGFEYYLIKNDIELFKYLIAQLHNKIKIS